MFTITTGDMFQQTNLIKVNKTSVTIKYPTAHGHARNIVLKEVYGEPDDKSSSGNGKKKFVWGGHRKFTVHPVGALKGG